MDATQPFSLDRLIRDVIRELDSPDYDVITKEVALRIPEGELLAMAERLVKPQVMTAFARMRRVEPAARAILRHERREQRERVRSGHTLPPAPTRQPSSPPPSAKMDALRSLGSRWHEAFGNASVPVGGPDGFRQKWFSDLTPDEVEKIAGYSEAEARKLFAKKNKYMRLLTAMRAEGAEKVSDLDIQYVAAIMGVVL